MKKSRDHLVIFDEHGIYEIKDRALIRCVSPAGVIEDPLGEVFGFGGLDIACEDTDGYCGNDALCGNRACLNTVCFPEGVNAVCNFRLNPIC